MKNKQTELPMVIAQEAADKVPVKFFNAKNETIVPTIKRT